MTLYTTNFAFPYPDGSNAPCDFDTDWCNFTNSVQALFDSYQAIVDRTIPVIPVARLLVTSNVTIANGAEVPFDTVSVDTAGWVDFDADQYGITTDRAGRFVAHAWARVSSTTLNNYINLRIRYTGQVQNPDDNFNDQAQGVGIAGCTAYLAALTTTTRWSLAIASASGSNVVVEAAEYNVMWHADRATP